MRATALHNALHVIRLLEAQQPVRFQYLCTRVQASAPTLSAILKTLLEAGWVRKGPDGYRLGHRFLWIATQMLETMDIRTIARPHLYRLRDRTRETVELSVPDGLQVLFIDKVEGVELLSLHAKVGSHLGNLHAVAPGKVLLAHLSPAERQAFYDSPSFRECTPRTLLDREILERRLALVQAQGTATELEEGRLGIVRVAGAILNHERRLEGIFSIAVPAFRFNRDRLDDLLQEVRQAGEEVSRELGFQGAYASPDPAIRMGGAQP